MVICLERGADCLHMVQLMPLRGVDLCKNVGGSAGEMNLESLSDASLNIGNSADISVK